MKFSLKNHEQITKVDIKWYRITKSINQKMGDEQHLFYLT